MLLTAVMAFFVAGSTSATDPVKAYLSQHPEMRLVQASDASGCPEPPKAGLQFSPVVRTDLTGDKREDVAFVVVTRETPPTFGVVALHGHDTVASEHWVVKPSPKRLRGVGIYSTPWGTYLFAGGCSVADTRGYEWAERLYLPARIY